MKRVVFYGWLVIEFFLITRGSLSLLEQFGDMLNISRGVSAPLRALGAIALGCVGLAMNFHPYYKINVRNTKRADN
jgi:hypothetical protein